MRVLRNYMLQILTEIKLHLSSMGTASNRQEEAIASSWILQKNRPFYYLPIYMLPMPMNLPHKLRRRKQIESEGP